jgi:tRNA-dihydrouridine synthase
MSYGVVWCVQSAAPTGLQLIGNGDVFSYTDWNEHVGAGDGALAACMIGRGALIKPWVSKLWSEGLQFVRLVFHACVGWSVKSRFLGWMD